MLKLYSTASISPFLTTVQNFPVKEPSVNIHKPSHKLASKRYIFAADSRPSRSIFIESFRVRPTGSFQKMYNAIGSVKAVQVMNMVIVWYGSKACIVDLLDQ